MNTDQILPLDPLVLPPAPSWFPFAWGWWASLAIVFFSIILTLMILKNRKQYRKAKRTALALFDHPVSAHTPSSALELLRQAALVYYPRNTIASLNGQEWYQFLDQQLGEARFMPKLEQWQSALYQRQTSDDNAQLIMDCRDWVERALPPKRGFRG